tara:strand:- start:18 stop:296 length:279 start_codon:yes stop_codon:yes gene_type:complete
MAMISSTASRLSAPRSSVKLDPGSTLLASTPSCSAMIAFTLSSTSSMTTIGAARTARTAGAAARPNLLAAGALKAEAATMQSAQTSLYSIFG